MPFQGTDTAADATEPITERLRTDQYPHLVEMATEYILQPGYDFGDEFQFGLDVILDALTRSLPETSPNDATVPAVVARHPSQPDPTTG